ncbi:MAG: zf-TFIIB domain-containing protein [Gammaproteobacteria bacterium]
MKCPKCEAAMREVPTRYKLAVQRCALCLGLFVSKEALAELSREWFESSKSEAIEDIDFGHASSGKRHDGITDINCPKCAEQMEHVYIEEQQHIWVEQCRSCEGIYFDAGELTDLRYKTFADWVRDRIKGKSPGGVVAETPKIRR